MDGETSSVIATAAVSVPLCGVCIDTFFTDMKPRDRLRVEPRPRSANGERTGIDDVKKDVPSRAACNGIVVSGERVRFLFVNG